MLTIRQAQWAALEQDRIHRLQQWLLAHLREQFPARVADWSDAELAAVVARGVERARAHGATESGAVCHYVHLSVVCGEGFEALPWARRVLEAEGLDGNRRMELLAMRARHALASA